MPSIVEAAQQLAATLAGAGTVRATHDPAWADANRPCLLVAPPVVDYVRRLNTWRVLALSSHPAGTLDALDQLDELVQAAVQLLDVERAEPVSYVLTPEAGPVPAYALTVTT